MKKIKKSIVFQRCEDLAGILVEQGYSAVNDYDLEYLLKRYIGADPRTVKAYKNHLVEFNFLQRMKDGFNILKEWIPVQKRLEAVAESSK
jgi:hypothetical protein